MPVFRALLTPLVVAGAILVSGVSIVETGYLIVKDSKC